ncbi:DsbA family protein, partial [Limimaricola soesokkakensis]|uniref:DsbA family protein n=1 Tax=Limimaricola soesokkakensis TaxID=1343159 RepID=UPI003518ED61
FFTRREDLTDPEMLVAVAAGLGFDRDAARAAIEDEARAELVRRKQGFWTAQGISGVPAMVIERQHLVTGAQGEETYARILQHLVEARAA